MSEDTGKWQTRVAEEADAGQRLDKWLSSWTELSRSRIRTLVETGNVRADGVILAKVTTKIRGEIEYAVRVPPPVDDLPNRPQQKLGNDGSPCPRVSQRDPC